MTAVNVQAPKRVRLPAVSHLLDQVIPKTGLDHWKVNHTAEGATILARAGEPLDRMTGADLLAAMKQAGIGADAASSDAQDRGTGVHEAIEHYMRTRELPDPLRDGIDMRLWGYHHAAARWLMSTHIEPVAVEALVADPHALIPYAGRVDLRARVNGVLTTVDYTTSEKLAIRSRKAIQALLYERGARACGDEPAERILVISFSPDGQHRVYERAYRHETTEALLWWLDEFQPIDRECESANRALKAARTEPADRPPPAAKVELVPGDPSTVPGAMKRALRRELPDGGVLTYEESPAGWVTKSGTRRRADWRAYYWQPPAQMELRAA